MIGNYEKSIQMEREISGQIVIKEIAFRFAYLKTVTVNDNTEPLLHICSICNYTEYDTLENIKQI